MRMNAAVLTGPRKPFEVHEVDLAPPGPGEVLVKVAASGLCASDLNAIDGKRTLVPFPAVLGHEAAGTVVETGPGVTRLHPGDTVVMSTQVDVLIGVGASLSCRRFRLERE